jgi:hypothetical protein
MGTLHQPEQSRGISVAAGIRDHIHFIPGETVTADYDSKVVRYTFIFTCGHLLLQFKPRPSLPGGAFDTPQIAHSCPGQRHERVCILIKILGALCASDTACTSPRPLPLFPAQACSAIFEQRSRRLRAQADLSGYAGAVTAPAVGCRAAAGRRR